MAQYAAFILTQDAVHEISEQQTLMPSWVREDNIAVYEMNIPNIEDHRLHLRRLRRAF